MDDIKKVLHVLMGIIGIEGGMVAAYFGVYRYQVGGTWLVVMTSVIGATVALISSPLVKSLEYRVNNVRKMLFFSYVAFLLSDVVFLLGVMLQNKWIMLSNALIWSPFTVAYSKALDYYPISIVGLKNRARIVSTRNLVMNLGMAVGALVSYFLYSKPLMLIGTVMLLKTVIITLLATSMPDASILHSGGHETVSIKNVFLSRPKLIMSFIGYFTVLLAVKAYTNARSPFIADIFGPNNVAFATSFAFVVTAIGTKVLMRYTAHYGRIIARTGWLLVLFVSIVLFDGKASYFILAVLGAAVFNTAVFSYRHYMMKKAPPELTHEVLHASSLMSIAAPLPLLLLKNVDIVVLAYASVAFAMAAVIIFAASKLVER